MELGELGGRSGEGDWVGGMSRRVSLYWASIGKA